MHDVCVFSTSRDVKQSATEESQPIPLCGGNQPCTPISMPRNNMSNLRVVATDLIEWNSKNCLPMRCERRVCHIDRTMSYLHLTSHCAKSPPLMHRDCLPLNLFSSLIRSMNLDFAFDCIPLVLRLYYRSRNSNTSRLKSYSLLAFGISKSDFTSQSSLVELIQTAAISMSQASSHDGVVIMVVDWKSWCDHTQLYQPSLVGHNDTVAQERWLPSPS